MQKCPFCKKIIIENNNKVDEFNQFKDGHTSNFSQSLTSFCNIKCNECNKNFTFILCKYCNKQIFYNPIDLSMLNGINIKCPYSTCGKYFYLTTCPKCKKKSENTKNNRRRRIDKMY